MTFLFMILPLPFIMYSTYRYNNLEMVEDTSYIIKISLLESVLSYLIIMILFLQGFISMFFVLLLIFAFIAALSLVIMYVEGEFQVTGKLELETIKNNIVLFALTILPLYVSLTMFRYLPFYYQIPLAILVSTTIFFIPRMTSRLFNPIYIRTEVFFSMVGTKELSIIIGGIFLFLISIYMFNLPTNIAGESLNLANNTPYLSIDGFPIDVENNFRQNEIIQIDSTELIDSEVMDYYYDDEHLYLYTTSNKLLIYNLSTKKLTHKRTLENTTVLDDKYSNYKGDMHYMFVKYDDDLILFGNTRIFKVTSNGGIGLLMNTSNNMKHYYIDGQLYLLNEPSNGYQSVYSFQNGKFILLELVGLSTASFESMIVISETLFYVIDNEYVLASDSDISFDIKEGSALYDQKYQIMYYTTGEFFKVTSNGTESEIPNNKRLNYYGIIIDNKIFYANHVDTHKSQVKIINDDFDIFAIYSHQELQPFYKTDFYTKQYIANYHNQDNKLEFLQVDDNYKHVVFTIYQLEELDVDIHLPFYSHYGVGILLSIFIAILVPTTHYRGSYTESSFDKVMTKDKEDNE